MWIHELTSGVKGSLSHTGRNRKIPATAILLVACLGIFIFPATGRAKRPETFKPFKLKTIDGTRKTLEDFENKATLVSFFYPRCPFCAQALPQMQTLYDKYKDEGLSAVWINVLPQENKLIPKWQSEHNFTVPILIGASQDWLQDHYKIVATPTEYLLGPHAEILFYQSGYKPSDVPVLESKIKDALNVAQ
ncbi:MAG TPA: TlpA disulfide reductase family protein [Candidatus Dormibacteraeota bacterium]|nr:TlpA disulfide reductase family protein [Candidatus Dormibacteraeota bacterium]